MSNKRPTIQMIAELSGVSRGTVDRVINHRSYVSPEVRARVERVIEEIGYKSPHASHIDTKTVGILMPNWTGYFYDEIMRAIHAAAQQLVDSHIIVLVRQCKTDLPDETVSLIDELVKCHVCGLALCAQDTPAIRQKVNELEEAGIPVVAFHSDLTDCSRRLFVGQDICDSGRVAGELIQKSIPTDASVLVLLGSYALDSHKARLNGFLSRMHESGFRSEQFHIEETSNDYFATYRSVQTHLELHPNIRAIYMISESIAGCADAVRDAGREGKLRIICHDLSKSTKALLRAHRIDFVIAQDIFRLGYLPPIILRDIL